MPKRIAPDLWFATEATEPEAFYISVDPRILDVARSTEPGCSRQPRHLFGDGSSSARLCKRPEDR